ncbi:MAG TPA: HupE/UreJ family protein [Thermoanaerobaculia bacterium]
MVLAFLISTSPAVAHELRPAYLQLRQTAADRYDVLWKVPARGDDLRLALHLELPDRCKSLAEPRGAFSAGAYAERWHVLCPGGLDGGAIRVAGLSGTLTDALVRLERLDGTSQTVRLTPSAPSFVVQPAHGPLEVSRTYLLLGVEHILLGIDHLLFVLGLLLLVKGRRRILATVTAFTVAHSITLAAAALGLVHVPQQPVEAAIALSILFVASEIARSEGKALRPAARDPRSPTLAARWPWGVAFAFGLLHGLGFAGALAEVGLPQNAIPVALLFFNIGVELGQLIFIAGVLALMGLLRPAVTGHRSLASGHWSLLRRIPAYAIGSLAAFWVIERVAAF